MECFLCAEIPMPGIYGCIRVPKIWGAAHACGAHRFSSGELTVLAAPVPRYDYDYDSAATGHPGISKDTVQVMGYTV